VSVAPDPTTRFSDRVSDYERFRPGYPAQLLASLRASVGLDPTQRVADVGAGTGKLAELFLDHGNEVFAVEPNAEMRATGERRLGQRRSFHSLAGRAEATGLASASVDLVVVGQAFHWFDADAARAEFLRVLRPPARVALVWNDRRRATGFMAGYEALVARHGTDYARVRHDRIGEDLIARFFEGARPRSPRGAGGAAGAGWRVERLSLQQRLDLEGLLGRLHSSSYLPAAGATGCAALRSDAERLFDGYARRGSVVVEYETRIYSGRLRPRSRRGEGADGEP